MKSYLYVGTILALGFQSLVFASSDKTETVDKTAANHHNCLETVRLTVPFLQKAEKDGTPVEVLIKTVDVFGNLSYPRPKMDSEVMRLMISKHWEDGAKWSAVKKRGIEYCDFIQSSNGWHLF